MQSALQHTRARETAVISDLCPLRRPHPLHVCAPGLSRDGSASRRRHVQSQGSLPSVAMAASSAEEFPWEELSASDASASTYEGRETALTDLSTDASDSERESSPESALTDSDLEEFYESFDCESEEAPLADSADLPVYKSLASDTHKIYPGASLTVSESNFQYAIRHGLSTKALTELLHYIHLNGLCSLSQSTN